MKVSVVGLGKLGAPLVAVLASKGFDVIGVDVHKTPIQLLNQGIAPVQEPHLQHLLERNLHKIKATQDYTAAILNTELTIIAVPTPLQADHLIEYEQLHQVLEKIGIALQQKASYHLVVIACTVMPGAMEGNIRKTLERYAKRPVGEWLGLCYNPPLIALGSAIHNLQNPDLVLIGESDEKAGEFLASMYRAILDNQAPICRMDWMNAEVAKLALSGFLSAKISYANMLSDLCDYLPGADVDTITAAIGLDHRIGSSYFKAAAAFGGPSFPRDTLALGALADRMGARVDLVVAAQNINEYQSVRIQNFVEMHALTRRIGVLGLSYKPGTKVVEASQGVFLANQLALQGYQVVVYDPQVLVDVQGGLLRDVEIADTIESCFEKADLLIIMTPWSQFGETLTREYLEAHPKKVIIDCWRILDAQEVEEACDLVHLGAGGLSAVSAFYD